MNSKLRNSLSALTASTAALAIELMVAVPAGNSPVLDVVANAPSVSAIDEVAVAGIEQHAERIDTLAQAVALSAGIAAASALALDADRDMDAHNEPRASRKGTRHRRQTVVMPYFSFSPRG
jgi:hypothetical protein